MTDIRTILLSLCLKHSNDWDSIYNDIRNHECPSDSDIQLAKDFDVDFITIFDDIYPDLLRHRTKPPFVLYYIGDVGLLSGVDEGRYIFLHGENIFRLPSERLCVITDDHRLCIGGVLTVWFNDDSRNIDRFGLAAGLCKTIVGTKVYDADSHSWFCNVTVPNALFLGSRIFVVPADPGTWNNKLISLGAIALTAKTAHDV